MNPRTVLGTWRQQIRVVLIGATVAFVLAIWGYATYLPGATVPDVVFHALNLLALNFRHVGVRPVPIPLEIARFLVHFVAAGAVGFTVYGVARRHVDRRSAINMSDHVVVLGETQRARMLAANYRTSGSKVALVGNLDPVHQEELRGKGVKVVDGAGGQLGDIIADARRVIAAGNSDDATAKWFTALTDWPSSDERPLHLVVEDPSLAVALRRQLGNLATSDLAASGVDICCVAERVSSAVLRRFPPRETGTAAPPPVVIGRSPLAEELVRQMLRGWYQPGWRLEVLGVTSMDDDLAHVAAELEPVGVLVTKPVANLVRDAARIVAEHARERRPTELDLETRREQGPLVFIAGVDDVTAVTIASQVLDRCGPARVVALVDEPDAWRQFASPDAGQESSGGLHLEAAGTMVTLPTVLEHTRIDRLAAELLAEHGDPSISPPAPFGTTSRGEIAPVELPERVLAAFDQFARASLEALRAARLRIGHHPAPPLMLQPSELWTVATHLRTVASRTTGLQAATIEEWLEVAAGLPASLVRVGMDLERIVDPPVMLDADLIERLARLAHEDYRQRRRLSGNPTRSEFADRDWDDLTELARESNRAQVRDLPVKLAAARRDVVMLDGREPQTDWLTDGLVERLAELEHRRWMHMHLRAGYRFGEQTDRVRKIHASLRAWEELGDKLKQYDRDVILGIPARLAAVGLGTRPMSEE